MLCADNQYGCLEPGLGCSISSQQLLGESRCTLVMQSYVLSFFLEHSYSNSHAHNTGRSLSYNNSDSKEPPQSASAYLYTVNLFHQSTTPRLSDFHLPLWPLTTHVTNSLQASLLIPQLPPQSALSL